MENGTNNPEPSWPQSAYNRAYAAAEPGGSSCLVDQQLGDSHNLSRSAFSLADYGSNTLQLTGSTFAAGFATGAAYNNGTALPIVPIPHAWGATAPIIYSNNNTFAPAVNSNPLQLTGTAFAAGFAADAADNVGTALPTALDPYTLGAAASTAHLNNNAFTTSINSNPSPLTGSTFAANAAYDGGMTYPTAPSPYILGAAAPMNHFMGADFHYPNPALPMTNPFAADTNGIGYHGQFPTANGLSTQFGAAIEPPNSSHSTHHSEFAPFNLAQPPPPPRPTCTTCGRNFRRKADLDRHAKKHRADAKVFRCACGGYSSYRKDKLDEHVRRSGHRAAGVSGMSLGGV